MTAICVGTCSRLSQGLCSTLSQRVWAGKILMILMILLILMVLMILSPARGVVWLCSTLSQRAWEGEDFNGFTDCNDFNDFNDFDDSIEGPHTQAKRAQWSHNQVTKSSKSLNILKSSAAQPSMQRIPLSQPP